jgi:hypothetical protein
MGHKTMFISINHLQETTNIQQTVYGWHTQSSQPKSISCEQERTLDDIIYSKPLLVTPESILGQSKENYRDATPVAILIDFANLPRDALTSSDAKLLLKGAEVR